MGNCNCKDVMKMTYLSILVIEVITGSIVASKPEMFTSHFLQVQVKSEVFGHKSKSSLKSLRGETWSSLKSLKNTNLMSLLVVMTLLSSVAIWSTKNTASYI